MTVLAARATTQQIRVLRDLSELETVRDAWAALQGEQVAADPDYFAIAVESDPKIVRPHVLAVERDGELTALLAARVELLELGVKLGYRKVFAPTVRTITVVYGGILGDVDEDTFRELVASIRESLAAGEADVAIFHYLPVDSPFHRIVAHELDFFSRQHRHDQEVHWELDLPSSFDELAASLSSSRRKSITRNARRLEREYGAGLEVRRFEHPAELDEYFDAVERVAVRTYQRAIGVSFGDTPAFRARTRVAMERGWYRGYVLYLDGQPVAFEHGVLYGGRFRSGRPGYDSAFAHLGVGTFLFMRALADLCADEDARVFDYDIGDADYKRAYGSRSWNESTVLVFAPTLRARWINLVRSVLLAATAAGKRTLERVDLVPRLKRRWRARLLRQAAA